MSKEFLLRAGNALDSLLKHLRSLSLELREPSVVCPDAVEEKGFHG